MRGRAIGGAVVAVALLVSVVLLRDQVGSTEAARGPTDRPARTATTTVAPDVLPVRPAQTGPRWQQYPMPAGALSAWANPSHVLISLDVPATAEPDATLRTQARDGSGAATGYQVPSPIWTVDSSLIMDGALYTVEFPTGEGALPYGWLGRVDLATGFATQLPIKQVRPGQRLFSVADELIIAGTSVVNSQEFCVVAIRPSTGTERTVDCGTGDPTMSGSDGGLVIMVPDYSPEGCTTRLLMPGRGERELALVAGTCQRTNLVVIGEWQTFLGDLNSTRPLVLTNGNQRVLLGQAKITAVPCHGRLYWVAGEQDESPLGTQLRRWRPGADAVEIVQDAAPGTGLGQPGCHDGTFSVSAYDLQSEEPGLTGLLVLDRP